MSGIIELCGDGHTHHTHTYRGNLCINGIGYHIIHYIPMFSEQCLAFQIHKYHTLLKSRMDITTESDIVNLVDVGIIKMCLD